MHSPVVSVITVARNARPHIGRCIRSVLAQSYPSVEYIVIDGASTDGTQDVIKTFGNRLAAWISEPDQGIADAFNKGLKLATGDITVLVNADDWLEPDAIGRVIKAGSDYDVLYGNLRQWNANGAQYVLRGDHTRLQEGMSLNHPAVFVKRAVYERIGYYNTRYRLAMDYEFLLRCHQSGLKFLHCDAVLSNMSMEGASDRHWLAALREVKQAKQELLGKNRAHHVSFLAARFRTLVSRVLLGSVLEPLFSVYRSRISNTTRQSDTR